MSMILSFGSAPARVAYPVRAQAGSGQPGIMVGLLIALALAAPFWLALAYLTRALVR